MPICLVSCSCCICNLAHEIAVQPGQGAETGLAGVVSSFKRQHPDTKLTCAQLMWALQCVRSRAFSGPFPGKLLRADVCQEARISAQINH